AGLPEVLPGSNEERSAWFSPAYGTRVPSKALKVRRDFEGQTSLVTCFSTSNAAFQPLVDQDRVIGAAIGRGEQSKETLFYRLHSDWPAGADGIRFDGKFLYRRTLGASTTALSAGGFCLLSVAGLLDVRSPVSVESLTVNDGRCEIAVPFDYQSALQIRVRDGLRLLVNARPLASAGSLPTLNCTG